MKHVRLSAAALAILLAGGTAATALAGGTRASRSLAAKVPAAADVAALAQPEGHPGLDRIRQLAPGLATTGIVRLASASPADTATATALRALGLRVQPMKHLPLAIVSGPAAALAATVDSGLAADVYPSERIELLDTESSDAMGAARARARGFTGKGVTVGVVDSGCDATHPDLADHVVHNVKLVGTEYLNLPPNPAVPDDGAIVIPIEMLPYNNSDLGSGHGTHVAGIIAADGTTSPDNIGVAPDANLVCYAIGEILFTTAVISAYDHMLDQPGLWDIDVVNNSWGNLYSQYDPNHPINVATKAVADQGVSVVFAAGNAGSAEGEASLNPWSMPPWVTSVAAGTVEHERASFSSNGLEYDNSTATPIGAGGHSTYLGDRIGVYHPDVTAPGSSISSSCDPLGALTAPCTPGGNASASGTSMASPHVAGAMAVLRQAKPGLTIDQYRQALQATADPLADGSPFWRAGYGYVDLNAAVSLVRRPVVSSGIVAGQMAADQRVLSSTPFAVQRSDFWTWAPPPVAVGGVTDSRTFTVPVGNGITAVKVAIGHPSTANVDGNNFMYDVTVTDAAGKVVGTTTESAGTGSASVLIDLAAAQAAYGDWTISVVGTAALSDPDTLDSDSALGDSITLQVAQLTPR